MGTIMIVDDSQFMRTHLRKCISLTQHQVIAEANNGFEAVNLFNKLKPDLVTMDITMTVMHGIDALKTIRLSDPNANVIMCSAMGQSMVITEALQLGAKDFIVKPFDEKRVIECINSILGKMEC